MTFKLTLILVLFCAQVSFAQKKDIAKLDSLINWLENHERVFEDSTLLRENSTNVMGLPSKGTGFGSQLIQLSTQQLNGKMLGTNHSSTPVEFQFKIKSAA